MEFKLQLGNHSKKLALDARPSSLGFPNLRRSNIPAGLGAKRLGPALLHENKNPSSVSQFSPWFHLSLPSAVKFFFAIGNSPYRHDILRSNLWLRPKNTFTTRAKSRRSPRWSTSGCAPACTSGASAMAPITMTAATSCSRKSSITPSTNSSWAHGKEVQINDRGQSRHGARFWPRHSAGQSGRLRFARSIPARNTTTTFSSSASGLNGVGTKAVNALSKDFLVRSHRDGEFVEASFKQGKLKKREEGQDRPNRTARSSGSSRTRRFSRKSSFKPEHIETPSAPLQLSEHRAEADLQRQDLSIPQRPAGPGDGRSAGRQQRADLSAAALLEQDAGILFHPQQQPLRRDVLFVRQRPIHQRRRHAPERLSRRLAQSRERIRAKANSKATTCAKAWSARSPSA